jgi:dipeptidyl aminopeptidase/acylaminoacyl peptidase
LFLVDIESCIENQITRGDWHDGNAIWAPDGKSVVFVSNRSKSRWNESDRTALWQIDTRGTKPRRLTPEVGLVITARFSPDGKQIVYAGSLNGSQSPHHKQLLTIDYPFESGNRAKPKILLQSDEITPSHIGVSGSSLEWADDGKSVYFLAAQKGIVPLWRINSTSKRLQKVIEGEFQIDGFSLAGKSIAFTSLWSSDLPEVSLAQGKIIKRITNLNTVLADNLSITPTRRKRFSSFDGLEIEMFLLFPPGYKKGKRYPLAINIHGGPHAMHPAVYNPLVFQIMAAAGYVVMLPNPRGSHSYGQQFQQACVEDWGGGDYKDIMCAVDHLIDQQIIDPAQLYVEGYSYGGIMTSWILGQTDRFRAAVVGAPVTNNTSLFGTDDEPFFTIESMGGTPQQVPDNYKRQSSMTHVENITTPVQLQHFEGDLRCPIGQSEQFYMALKFLGREVEFVRYPRGSHVGRTPSQYQDMLKRTLDWFADHDK